MGVTIHFEGRLRGSDAYEHLVRLAEGFAVQHGWRIESIAEVEVALCRVQNEEDWDYVGPTRGVALYPHEDCDPLRLEFDRDLYVQEFVKTQFAPIEIHLKAIELLRLVAPEFEALEVEDEGEYWDTSDLAVLEQHIRTCRQVLDGELKAHPDYAGPVRLPSGRIVDYMSRE